MGDTTRDEWDAHYASGRTFSALRDWERELLAAHVPAPEGGGLALDAGCGLGELARHLAKAGYHVDAVDHAPAALAMAEAAGAGVGAARVSGEGPVVYRLFDIERDSLDQLPHPAYDLISFRLSWAFVHDRTRLLNRLRERLRPGGALCVITPVAESVPDDKRGIALDAAELDLLCAGWTVVERHAVDGLALVILRDPVPAKAVPPKAVPAKTVTAKATTADKGRPSPHALTGAGVVVTDPAGRILLGWSVRGVWELPGGKNDAGEDFLDAAVRELAEETGLEADRDAARVPALLMDSAHGMPRLTAAVHVTSYRGAPVVKEPHLIHRWEWHEPADLPRLAQPLFTPSAHVIDVVRPGLLTGLPPVHRYPVASGSL
ncbi:NUDIX domain-containing protein [Streptomyces sp. NPDC005648]|uniref:bifunctional class I SAM-dependent methyltransferase/NUDIX hydrolase n=1 Tax=Streptomyces sp. NPDC005648 TaxID=3157044 RepID=UPI0033B0B06C